MPVADPFAEPMPLCPRCGREAVLETRDSDSRDCYQVRLVCRGRWGMLVHHESGWLTYMKERKGRVPRVSSLERAGW